MTVKRPYLWLALAVFAVYGRSLYFGYTYLDDHVLILEDYRFLSDWRNLLEIFRRDVFHTPSGGTAYYRPVFTLSLFLDAQWAGLSAAGYHFTSVLVHAAACGLLYRLLLTLAFTAESSFIGALLFALHPALASTVCFIPGRNDALFGAFTFAAFTAFLRWFESDGSPKRLAAFLSCFALALFTKETAIMLPVACAAYALLDPARARARRWGPLILGCAAVLACWQVLRAAALRQPIRLPWNEMLHSLWIGKTGLLQYFGKALLPFDLSVLPTIQDTSIVPGALSAAALIAVLAYRRPVKRSTAAFGLAWFVLFFLPTLILHSTTVDLMGEQRLYVPLAGLVVAALAWDPSGPRRYGLPVAVLFAALAFRYSAHFRDQRSFWESAARTSPRLPLAHRNLGAILYLEGDLDGAAAEYRKALALNPVEPMAHNNLGLVYMHKGRAAEAEAAYLRELELYPNYVNASLNLGLLYARTGRPAEAAASWRRVLAIEPGNADAEQALRQLGAKRP